MSARPRVFVTRAIADEALRALGEHAEVDLWPRAMPPPYAQLRRHARDAHAILSMVTDRIDAELIAGAPRLRVISNLAVGLDNVDIAAATRAGIAVGHTPGVLTEATADLAFALLMTAARRVAEGDREVRAGRWRTWGPAVMLGRDVFGATLGIIGWGKIGRAMARRAAGFRMRVLYCSRRGSTRQHANSAREVARGRRVPFARLLAESDFVSLHVPITPATRHMLGARQFAAMKPGAIVINTARGAVLDQRALYRTLKSGHLGGAALDVTDPEPISRDDPLLELSNVVITPHIGSASYTARRRMGEIAVANIVAVLRGELPPFCANPQVRIKRQARTG
jgi:glyoxylate reductase